MNKLSKEERRKSNLIAVTKYKASKKGINNIKKYYRENKEKIILLQKQYRDNNIEKEKERHRVKYANKYGYKPNDWVRPGSYNVTLAERHSGEWVQEELTIYKLKIVDIDGTIFYKIGLTTNLTNRLYKIPYNVEIIKSFKMDKYEAVYFEHNYLQNVNKYKPLKSFKGYTECFI